MSGPNPQGWMCPVDGTCTTDTAVQILRFLFDTKFINAYISGNPALTKVAETTEAGIAPSVIPVLVNQVSSLAMFIALLFLCFYVLKSVLSSANDGELKGVSRGSGSWMGTYGRPLFSVMMLAPTISGYSLIAVFVLWVVMISNGAANRVYMMAADRTINTASLLSFQDNPTYRSVNSMHDPVFYGALHGYCVKSAFETLGSQSIRLNMSDVKHDPLKSISFTIEDTESSGKPGKSNVSGNLCGTYSVKYNNDYELFNDSNFTILKEVTGRGDAALQNIGKNITIARALSQLHAYKAGFRSALGAEKFSSIEAQFNTIETMLTEDLGASSNTTVLRNAAVQINSAGVSLPSDGWPVIKVNDQSDETVTNGENGQTSGNGGMFGFFAPKSINIKPLIGYAESSSDVLSEAIINYLTSEGLTDGDKAGKLKAYEQQLLANGWLGAGTAKMRLASVRKTISNSIYAVPSSFALAAHGKQDENNSKFNEHLELVAGVNDGVFTAFNNSSLKDATATLNSNFALSAQTPTASNSLDPTKMTDRMSTTTASVIMKMEQSAVNNILGTSTSSPTGSLDFSGTDGDMLAKIQYSGEMFGIASLGVSTFKVAIVSSDIIAKILGKNAISAILSANASSAAADGYSVLIQTLIIPLLNDVIEALDNLRTMLGTIVPNLPYLLLAMAGIGWILQIIMTVFGMQLFLIMHAMPGDRFMGSQQQGWVTILGLFFRPILIISAFFVALFMYEPIVIFFTNAFFSMRAQTGGASMTPDGNSLAFITSFRDFWYMYSAALIAVTYLVFGTVQELSDNILDWMGTNLLRNFGNINSEKLMAGVAGSAIAASKSSRANFNRGISEAAREKEARQKRDSEGKGGNDPDKEQAKNNVDSNFDKTREDAYASFDANSRGTAGSTTDASAAKSSVHTGALGAMGLGAGFDEPISRELSSLDSAKGTQESDGKSPINLDKVDDVQDVNDAQEGIELGSDEQMGGDSSQVPTDQPINDAAYNSLTETPDEAQAAEYWNALDKEQKEELAALENPTEAQEAIINAGESMAKDGKEPDGIDASAFNQERAAIDNPTPDMSDAMAKFNAMDTDERAELLEQEGKWDNKQAAMVAAGIAAGQITKDAHGAYNLKSADGKLQKAGVSTSKANAKEADSLAKRNGENPRPMAKPKFSDKAESAIKAQEQKGKAAINGALPTEQRAGSSVAHNASEQPLVVGDKALSPEESAKATQAWNSMSTQEKTDLLQSNNQWTGEQAAMVAAGVKAGEVVSSPEGGMGLREQSAQAAQSGSNDVASANSELPTNQQQAQVSAPVNIETGAANQASLDKLVQDNTPAPTSSTDAPVSQTQAGSNDSVPVSDNNAVVVNGTALPQGDSTQATQAWNSMSTQEKTDLLQSNNQWTGEQAAMVAAGVKAGEVVKTSEGSIALQAKDTVSPATAGGVGNTNTATANNVVQGGNNSSAVSQNQNVTPTPVSPSASNQSMAQSLVQANKPQGVQTGATGPEVSSGNKVGVGGANAVSANSAQPQAQHQPSAEQAVAAMNVKPEGAQNYSKTVDKTGNVVESWQAQGPGGTTTNTLTTRADGTQTMVSTGRDTNGGAVSVTSNFNQQGQLQSQNAETVRQDGAVVSSQKQFNEQGVVTRSVDAIQQPNGNGITTTNEVNDKGFVTTSQTFKTSEGTASVKEVSSPNGTLVSREKQTSSYDGSAKSQYKDVVVGQQVQSSVTKPDGTKETTVATGSLGRSEIRGLQQSDTVVQMSQATQRVISNPQAREQRKKTAKVASNAVNTQPKNNQPQSPVQEPKVQSVDKAVTGTKVETQLDTSDAGDTGPMIFRANPQNARDENVDVGESDKEVKKLDPKDANITSTEVPETPVIDDILKKDE